MSLGKGWSCISASRQIPSEKKVDTQPLEGRTRPRLEKSSLLSRRRGEKVGRERDVPREAQGYTRRAEGWMKAVSLGFEDVSAEKNYIKRMARPI